MSQRQAGYYGGIQKGQVAAGRTTRVLEGLLVEINKSGPVVTAAKNLNLHWKKNLTAHDLFPNYLSYGCEIMGCRPDGGVWLNAEGVPIITSELKHQGRTGNVVERFFKNHSVLRSLNPKLIDICFCTGEGFFNGNSGERIMNSGYFIENRDYNKSPWGTGDGASLKLFRFRDINYEYIKQTMTAAIVAGMESVC